MDGENGDDTNSGLSWAEAKATIQAGIAAANTGEKVRVKAGVYDASSDITVADAVDTTHELRPIIRAT